MSLNSPAWPYDKSEKVSASETIAVRPSQVPEVTPAAARDQRPERGALNIAGAARRRPQGPLGGACLGNDAQQTKHCLIKLDIASCGNLAIAGQAIDCASLDDASAF